MTSPHPPAPSGAGDTRGPGEALLPSGGDGLIGLAERIRPAGGSMESGPRPDGGFRVRMTLPVEPVPAAAP